MFGNRHSFLVVPARGGRKYQYRCTCGAQGWETESAFRAQQMGQQHVNKAKAK